MTKRTGATVKHIRGILKARFPPTSIQQEPLHGSQKIFKRLCSLDGRQADSSDLLEYIRTINYGNGPIQADLFRYLLPACLSAWEEHLMELDGGAYGGFYEQFFPSLIRHSTLHTLLNSREVGVVDSFVIDCILRRIEVETVLKEVGRSSSSWFEAVSAYSVVFPNLEFLWNRWWALSSFGHAVGAVQYISCLLYRDDENPVFGKWRERIGGGPPFLTETGCVFPDGARWQPENVAFISSSLTVESAKLCIERSSAVLFPIPDLSAVCNAFLGSWNRNASIIKSRIEQLPLLASDLDTRYWFN
jgi:hypothetical protein